MEARRKGSLLLRHIRSLAQLRLAERTAAPAIDNRGNARCGRGDKVKSRKRKAA